MARFDVYRNIGGHQERVPFLLDVQSELLDRLDTRIVVPLRKRSADGDGAMIVGLTPELELDGEIYVMETSKLGAVPVRALRSKVASLNDQHDRIVAALDFLFQGF
ncbi:MAG TPA: CcdB family protein [Rhodocyclaceae bacterium]|nr:CcdB family protein [Rhodocyclaceae bacterium]